MFPWYQYTYGIVSRNQAIMDKNCGIWLNINLDDKEKWAISIKTSWIGKNHT